ncbi:MAG: cation:proton antiporter [Lentimicrobium sp.]|nr:cation:proton antiporter [Lentimicrobium sp.]
MKKNRSNTLLNFVVVGGVSILLWIVLDSGKNLDKLSQQTSLANRNTGIVNAFDVINFHHPLSLLILQILVIIAASRMLGWLISLINQPSVIGEILAGIALGPSLLGLYFPGATAFLFPAISLDHLELLSQVGLILFMFIIGMELDINILKKRAGSSMFISNVSIVVPFLMGTILSLFLFERFAPEGTKFLPFALFIGIALSITAFPVLARIVQERGLTKSPLGITAITCAAINDITAWGILALVVAIANAGSIVSALITILLSAVYVLIMLLIIRPLLDAVAKKYTVRETISKHIVALVLSTLFLSAWITEVIGIHALFGAFMAGVIIPDNARFKSIMAEKIEDVSIVLLLPLFFVYTGLRTQIGLLNEPDLWLIAALVIAFAVVGKFAGTAIAARITGQTWKESLLLGSLMNTRGLIELVALNIGYDIGVLSPEIFTILVLVAIVTTLMTGPLMSFINYIFRSNADENIDSGLINVIAAFGPPEAGGRLTYLIDTLLGNRKKGLKITALHMTPNTDISIKNAKRYEEEAFSEVKKVSKKLGIEVKTIYRTAENVANEIIKTTNRGNYDLLIVGSSRPLLRQDETGGKARYFFENARCNVGLFIDKGFKEIKRILILTESEDENFLFDLSKKFESNCIIETSCLIPESVPVNQSVKSVFNQNLSVEPWKDYSENDLIISTLDFYRLQRESGATWIDGKTSILLINRGKN